MTEVDDWNYDADAAYERHLETRYEEDPRDLIDEANDLGLQELRAGREERVAPVEEPFDEKAWHLMWVRNGGICEWVGCEVHTSAWLRKNNRRLGRVW